MRITPAKRSLRVWFAVTCVVLIFLAYVVAALTVLPQWLVSINASGADANAQLNAVTTTRATVLGVLTPVVLIIGGVVAGLSYSETVRHNRRTDALARRQRRADVYAELLSACDECMNAALDSRGARYANMDAAEQISRSKVLLDKRAAMDRVADRVTLLGSDEVQAPAAALDHHAGVQVATKAGRDLTEEEWTRVMHEYGVAYKAFLVAARSDLEFTR